MLIKLPPDQVSDNWGLLEKAIAPSLNGDGSVSFLLQQVLAGRVVVWVGMADDDIIGVVTTYITESMVGSRRLVILSLQGFRHLSPEVLKISMEDLKKYAKAKGCSKVIAYTQRKGLAKLFVDEFGGNADTTVLEMEVS